MSLLIVTQNPADWKVAVPDIEVVSSKAYLTDPRFMDLRNVKVYNLCKSYRYQTAGYYVSLLAEARGHQAVPDVTTIQDLKYQTIIRVLSDDLDGLIQKSLKDLQTNEFTLSVYFGKNVARKYDKLSKQLFNLFTVPLLRASFSRDKKNHNWILQNVSAISLNEVPDTHLPYLFDYTREYFIKPYISKSRIRKTIYDLAILTNPSEKNPPSDEKALNKFIKAAHALDFYVDLINKDDYNRITEFDALFIRETTAVNHHTYRFARKAFAEGLIVIDDPLSIVRCTNKVYQAELMIKTGISIPKTLIVNKDNMSGIIPALGLPCILKQPDSSFSEGVVKVKTETELEDWLKKLLDSSDLIIAQEYLPTDFDWRIGILNGEPLYACKYYMAPGHWQIMNWQKKRGGRYGKVETFHLTDIPKQVVVTAIKAARLIGDGLYGVDIKLVDEKPYVIEINDNPSIDSGLEDSILKDELYHQIMSVFFNRIRESKKLKWI